MERIPVNIISGFLGSGKTTAIIQLLEQKKPEECWAIVVNEFGKVSIDGQTLQSKSVSGTVYDISGGCICCSAKIYLKENLENIVETGKFDRIIIEPSGLGGIEMVSEMVGLIPQLSLMPIICMVDITGLDNPRFQRIPIYGAQIRMSDRIVFSKCDLVNDQSEQERLIEKFKVTFPGKNLCLKPGTNLLEHTFNDRQIDNEKMEFRLIRVLNPNLSDVDYQEKNYRFSPGTIFDTERLCRFFKENSDIIRAKGHIRTEKGWMLVNFTLSGCSFDPCQEKGQSEIVFITEKLGSGASQNLNEKLPDIVLHG